jgi:DNA-directed RNA polymerase specialized sigma24 family protein
MAVEEVTQWIHKLSGGDQRAAQILWETYFNRLVNYARRKLDGLPLRAADEEDVALSAMYSFCRGMEQHRFDQVNDRDDLWKLLVTITARKACAQRRKQYANKRGGGHIRGESVFFDPAHEDGHADGIGAVLGQEPTPELACMVAENCQQMLDSLKDETLQQVAVYRLEGYGTAEIAEKLGCVKRSVERKLERIRAKWALMGLNPVEADSSSINS